MMVAVPSIPLVSIWRMSNQTAPERSQFLPYVHHFRGFAIANVVALHTMTLPDGLIARHADAEMIQAVLEIAFHGCTIYFVFIAGFLFAHLSDRFSASRYYRARFSNLIVPYLFLSVVLFPLKVLITDQRGVTPTLGCVAHALVYGTVQAQFWYVPWVVPVIIVSPLLLHIPKRWLRVAVLLSSALPILGTRSGSGITIGTYVSLAPVYFLGCLCAFERESFVSFATAYRWPLAIVAAAASGCLVPLTLAPIRFGPLNLAESAYYVQKLSICILVFGIFASVPDRRFPTWSLLATYSFPLYFTHLLIGNMPVRRWYYGWVLRHSLSFLFPATLLFGAFSLCATLAFCVGLYAIFGPRTRFFIGQRSDIRKPLEPMGRRSALGAS